jgi:hypothetical protein
MRPRRYVHPLRRCFEAARPDARSLALLRIGSGLVLLWDMWLALSVAGDWWALQGHTTAALPSWLVTTPTFVVAALGVVAVALLLIAGWRTGPVTLAAWFCACAYHFAADGSGDFHSKILCVWLLWSLLLPTETALSLDTRAGRARSMPSWRVDLGGLGLLLSVAGIYLSTALWKSGPAWWSEGTAVWLSLLDRGTPASLGRWLALEAPSWVWPPVAWGVLAVEWAAAPALLWRRTRAAAIVVLAALHGGTWFLMELEAFPLTAISGLVAVAPGSLWQRLGWRRNAPLRDGLSGRTDRWLVAAIVVVLLGSAEGLRVATIRRSGDPWPYPGSAQVARLYYWTGLELDWHMYGPEPFDATGWWVVCAWMPDSRVVDPLTGAPPTAADPGADGPVARLRWQGLSHPPAREWGPQDTVESLLDWRGVETQRLALVWMREELVPYRRPEPVALLARTRPAGSVTLQELADLLGQPVFEAAYDDSTGDLLGAAR